MKGVTISVNQTMANERIAAQANGVGWDMMTIGQIFTLQLLAIKNKINIIQ